MKLNNISVKYGDKTVYDNFSLEIPKGITCILGASGCGKTTLLNVIARALPFSGKVDAQSVSYIFQSPTLIPSMTVEKNVEYVLKEQIKDKKKRKKIVFDILDKVGLEKEKKNFPGELSGGMAQRVALARAFCYPSDCLLMDEPFKGLDVTLKKNILSLFLSLYRQNNRDVVFVTHDIDEAILLADNIFVLTNNAVLGTFNCNIPQEERTVTSLSDIKEQIYALL